MTVEQLRSTVPEGLARDMVDVIYEGGHAIISVFLGTPEFGTITGMNAEAVREFHRWRNERWPLPESRAVLAAAGQRYLEVVAPKEVAGVALMVLLEFVSRPDNYTPEHERGNGDADVVEALSDIRGRLQKADSGVHRGDMTTTFQTEFDHSGFG